RDLVRAAALAACLAVVAVDPRHHARAAAADERPDDRLAVPPQGGRRPGGIAVIAMPRLPRGLVLPAVVALAGFIVLIGLGTWHVERKAWKEELIATLERRLRAAPVSLPPTAQWARISAEDFEFVRVRVLVEWPRGSDALLYTGVSALRDDVKSQGYFVFA